MTHYVPHHARTTPSHHARTTPSHHARTSPPRRWYLPVIAVLLLTAALVSTVHGGSTRAAAAVAGGVGPTTALHFTANGNFSSSGTYLPGADGFNVADVGSVGQLNSLPAGVQGLAWVGLCGGANSAFTSVVNPYIGNAKLFGFYLFDEPDPTGQWKTACPQANLKAESDYVHAHLPGVKTFIIVMNMSSSSSPSYAGTYNPANSDIDLYGLDPYPCRTELNGCDNTYITKGVAAAEASGIPQSDIVPVYQTFGLGNWVDDGGGKYAVPTATQEQALLSTWQSVVPSPVFDYAYSWGSQNADQALSGLPALQSVFADHNGTPAPPPTSSSASQTTSVPASSSPALTSSSPVSGSSSPTLWPPLRSCSRTHRPRARHC